MDEENGDEGTEVANDVPNEARKGKFPAEWQVPSRMTNCQMLVHSVNKVSLFLLLFYMTTS